MSLAVTSMGAACNKWTPDSSNLLTRRSVRSIEARGQTNGSFFAAFAIRPADVGPQAGVQSDSGRGAGAGNWGEYGRLQLGERIPAQTDHDPEPQGTGGLLQPKLAAAGLV